MKGEKYLFVVSGPSGTGKDTVVAKLLGSHPEIEKTVSATTRTMREGEVNGKNYHFLTKEQFETALAEGNIVEHTCYCENYYGTLRSEVERHMEQQIPVILVIEVEGARQHQADVPRFHHHFCHAAGYERAGTPPALPWDRSGGSHSEAPCAVPRPRLPVRLTMTSMWSTMLSTPAPKRFIPSSKSALPSPMPNNPLPQTPKQEVRVCPALQKWR